MLMSCHSRAGRRYLTQAWPNTGSLPRIPSSTLLHLHFTNAFQAWSWAWSCRFRIRRLTLKRQSTPFPVASPPPSMIHCQQPKKPRAQLPCRLIASALHSSPPPPFLSIHVLQITKLQSVAYAAAAGTPPQGKRWCRTDISSRLSLFRPALVRSMPWATSQRMLSCPGLPGAA